MRGRLRHRLPKGPSSSGEASPSAYRAASRVQIPPTARAEYPEKAISYQETNQNRDPIRRTRSLLLSGARTAGRWAGRPVWRNIYAVRHWGHSRWTSRTVE